jgi:DNA-binding transcriptional ArsR family regulator
MTTPAQPSEPVPELDLSLAALFAGWALTDEVTRRLTARGFTGLRFSHGFLVQRLVASEQSIAALAQALDITQQAVSKTVAELERLGYVRRRPDPRDARVRLVALTDRGRAAVQAAREERAAVVDGAAAAVRARRVRPPA